MACYPHMPEKIKDGRRALDRESLVYRQPRAIRYPHPDHNYLAFALKDIESTTTPYSQGFRFLYRHTRRRLGSPWVGPINAAAPKRLKLAIDRLVTQVCLPLPLLSSSAGFRTPFPLPSSSVHKPAAPFAYCAVPDPRV